MWLRRNDIVDKSDCRSGNHKEREIRMESLIILHWYHFMLHWTNYLQMDKFWNMYFTSFRCKRIPFSWYTNLEAETLELITWSIENIKPQRKRNSDGGSSTDHLANCKHERDGKEHDSGWVEVKQRSRNCHEKIPKKMNGLVVLQSWPHTQSRLSCPSPCAPCRWTGKLPFARRHWWFLKCIWNITSVSNNPPQKRDFLVPATCLWWRPFFPPGVKLPLRMTLCPCFGGTARARRTRSDHVCDNDDVLIVDDDVNQGGETNPTKYVKM